MRYQQLFLFTIAICLLLAQPNYAQRGDWFNEPDEHSFRGSGSAGNPYLIESVADLVHLAERANRWGGEDFAGQHFLLTRDLNLGQHFWIPIGSEREKPFRGSFNGNGRVIREIYIGDEYGGNIFEACGLFGYLGEGASIVNLTIMGGRIIGGERDSNSRAGALAGLIACNVDNGREDSIIIRNCRNLGVEVVGANVPNMSVAGGLIGEAYSYCRGGGAAIILLENCSNNSRVAGGTARRSFAGGIMGKGRGHGQGYGRLAALGLCLINAGRNAGTVQGGTANGRDAISAVGGILGQGQGAADGINAAEGIASIRYCINTAKISGGDAATAYAQSYAGGLLGYGDGYSGGRADRSEARKATSLGSFLIAVSANRGQVESGKKIASTAQSFVGGLLGFAASSVYESGEIGAGNIQFESKFSLENCYSYASVSALRGMAGGLAGCLVTRGNGSNRNASVMLRNSYAAGTLNKSDSIVQVASGGIVGCIRKARAAAWSPQVDNCLVALSYMSGAPNRTFRIVGQITGLSEPFAEALSNNYARVGGGKWGNALTQLNGKDWDMSLQSPPFPQWDFRNRTWLAEADHSSLPILNRLPNQAYIPIPVSNQ